MHQNRHCFMNVSSMLSMFVHIEVNGAPLTEHQRFINETSRNHQWNNKESQMTKYLRLRFLQLTSKQKNYELFISNYHFHSYWGKKLFEFSFESLKDNKSIFDSENFDCCSQNSFLFPQNTFLDKKFLWFVFVSDSSENHQRIINVPEISTLKTIMINKVCIKIVVVSWIFHPCFQCLYTLKSTVLYRISINVSSMEHRRIINETIMNHRWPNSSVYVFYSWHQSNETMNSPFQIIFLNHIDRK